MSDKIYNYDEIEIKLSDIIVPKGFKNSKPSKFKIDNVYSSVALNIPIDKHIYVNNNLELVDGYILYLVYKQLGYETCKVRKPSKFVKYVFGKHPNSITDVEYVWRMKDKYFNVNLNIGQKILVQAKSRIAPVIVTRVEILDSPPVNSDIKYVVMWKNIK